MPIKSKVKQIATLHDTNDPLQLASRLDTLIFYEPFKNIWGYFNTSKRIKMIHVNSNLDSELQRFVIAHELGHRFLHPHINVPFLRANTLQSVEKIEREANQFAVELLISDQLLLDGATLYEAAKICGVPQEIAYLKRPPEKNFWKDDHSFFSM